MLTTAILRLTVFCENYFVILLQVNFVIILFNNKYHKHHCLSWCLHVSPKKQRQHVDEVPC